jgi:uncharacterized protein YndB with AHSA1/START domain
MRKPIDLSAAIGAVTREVRTVEREERSARVVVATRVFDTGIADLWDAITTRDRIARWLMPIEGTLRLGGRYQLRGNAGGTITMCEPPRRLAATWEMGGEVSWLDVQLVERGAQTQLVLEHTAHVDEMRWGQFGPGAVGVGWDLVLLGLYLHLSGDMASPEEGMAWATSDEGKRFASLASDDWGRASTAAGTDAQAARAAAERTTAFYTGA